MTPPLAPPQDTEGAFGLFRVLNIVCHELSHQVGGCVPPPPIRALLRLRGAA